MIQIGCGTMGVAIISGVIASLESSSSKLIHDHATKANSSYNKWESHTPGTSTPTIHSPISESSMNDPTIPTRFIACVSRKSSVTNLEGVFSKLGQMGEKIEIYQGRNVEAVKQANVILLWYVS
jgi:pyrroline-5-carboxylate reductase